MPLRSFTEAEIVLKARRRLERPLLATVWLGVVMFSLWRGNVFYLAAGTLAVGVNLFAVHRAKEVYVHQFFVNVGVLVATGILLLEVFGRPGELQLLVKLGNYLILIQLCKLFERKSNRDYLQMLVLSPLLVVAATLYCPKLWFALLLGVYAALLCYTAMVFTLKRALDAAARAQLATEAGPMSPRRVAWNAIRDWPGGAIVRRTLQALVVMGLIGVIMFLATPRTHAGGTGTAGVGGMAESGYSASGRLGEARGVYLSDRIAMTVKLVSQPQGPRGAVYLRGKTFDHYAGSRWTKRRPPRRLSRHLVPPRSLLAEAQVLEVSLVPRLLSAPALFVPPGTVHVDARHGQGRINLEGEGHLGLARPPEGNVHYTTYSFPHPRTPAQRRYLAARRRAPREKPDPWQTLRRRFGSWLRRRGQDDRRTTSSAVPRRVRKLAETWCADLIRARDAGRISHDQFSLEVARRIAQKLKQRCAYSLDLSAADRTRDAVEDFLFHTKRGHCEYFASALTVMCQALGVEARWAVGFLAEGVESVGERTFVRDRDAHAWTEVYTSQTGWLVVDASPPRSGDESAGLWAGIKDFWQRVGFLWDEHVLGYDTEARNRVGRWLWEAGARAMAAARSAATGLRRSVVALLARGRVDRALGLAGLVTALVALLLEIVLVVRLIAHRLRRRRGGQGDPRELRFVQDLFDLLMRHGLEVRAHQTPRRLAARAATDLDLPAETLLRLVDLYYRLRWGAGPATAQEIRAAERQVAEVRRVLARPSRSQ